MSNKAENEAGESTGDHAAIGGTPLPPGAPPTPTLVTREQLARAMGKHSRTIRRWEQTRLAPALTVGDDGVHRFNVARVQEIFELQERATPATPESFDNGETTAAVFELFAQGVEAVDVVMRMKLPAFAVDALRRRWATLRGGYMVPREVALEISSVRGEVIADAASLLRNLKQTTPNTCDECHEEVGHQYDGWSQVFCGLCAARLSARRANEASAAAAREKATRQRLKEQQKAEAEESRRMDAFLEAMRAPPEERLNQMIAAIGR